MNLATLLTRRAELSCIEHQMDLIERARGRDGIATDHDRLAHLWRALLGEFAARMELLPRNLPK